MRIRELARARVRYGYRRIRVLLNREGWNVGRYLVYRLYSEEGLTLKKRPARRKRVAAVTRQEKVSATAAQSGVESRFCVRSTCRRSPIPSPHHGGHLTPEKVLPSRRDPGLNGADVVRVLNHVKSRRGAPQFLFCDNGSEFTSQAMDLWARKNQVRIDFSRPDKPTDKAFIESFYGTFRSECLSAHWFASITEARQLIESWRREHNESRPHSLAQRTPSEFARQIAASSALVGCAAAGNSR